MLEIINRETARDLMALKGESRGISIEGDLQYIVYREGKEGLSKLEKEMEKLGYPFRLKEIKSMRFYPIGYEALILAVAEKLFNYTEEDFFKMGVFNSKLSLIIKLFMKYFFSVEKVAKEASVIWKKYYTIGNIKVVEINNEKGYGIVRLENFKLNKVHCSTLRGYFASIIKMVVAIETSCQETKCPFDGDQYHEFIVSWLKNNKN